VKKELQDQLDSVFAAHAQRVEARKTANQTKETEAEAFVRAFKEKRAAVFKPALEKISAYLGSQGVKSDVVESEEGSGRLGGPAPDPPSIELRLYMGDEGVGSSPRAFARHEQPHLAISANKSAKRAHFHENTVHPGAGGQSGGAGDYPLDQVTEDLIHEKALALVRKVFGS
jgi:hypothetical protein